MSPAWFASECLVKGDSSGQGCAGGPLRSLLNTSHRAKIPGWKNSMGSDNDINSSARLLFFSVNISYADPSRGHGGKGGGVISFFDQWQHCSQPLIKSFHSALWNIMIFGLLGHFYAAMYSSAPAGMQARSYTIITYHTSELWFNLYAQL